MIKEVPTSTRLILRDLNSQKTFVYLASMFMSRKKRQNVFHSTSVEKSKKVWKVDLLFTTVK